jgi:hypothetical protein
MAAQTCVNTQHATLSGTTADSITFTGSGSSLCITNRDTTNTLYFRCDGTTAVAAADETYVVLPLQWKVLDGSKFGGNMSVSVVGNGGGYSAEIF